MDRCVGYEVEWTAALVHTVLIKDVEDSDCSETLSRLLSLYCRETVFGSFQDCEKLLLGARHRTKAAALPVPFHSFFMHYSRIQPTLWL